jgi:hypothetical protein
MYPRGQFFTQPLWNHWRLHVSMLIYLMLTFYAHFLCSLFARALLKAQMGPIYLGKVNVEAKADDLPQP